jgi:hypothetical protein
MSTLPSRDPRKSILPWYAGYAWLGCGLTGRSTRTPSGGPSLRSGPLRRSPVNSDVRAEHLAQLQFGLNPSQMKVVTLAVAATPEAAELLEREIITAPQYTGVRRNGTLVMACTFAPPDPELEGRVTTAFSNYRGGAI